MEAILIIILATTPTQIHALAFGDMVTCEYVQKIYAGDRKVRWPHNIWHRGGGNPLSYIPCGWVVPQDWQLLKLR